MRHATRPGRHGQAGICSRICARFLIEVFACKSFMWSNALFSDFPFPLCIVYLLLLLFFCNLHLGRGPVKMCVQLHCICLKCNEMLSVIFHVCGRFNNILNATDNKQCDLLKAPFKRFQIDAQVKFIKMKYKRGNEVCCNVCHTHTHHTHTCRAGTKLN